MTSDHVCVFVCVCVYSYPAVGVPLCMCAFLHLFVHSRRKTQRQMGNMEWVEGAFGSVGCGGLEE